MTRGSQAPALPPRLEGRLLVAARATWLVIAVVSTVLVSVGFVRAFADPLLVAMPPLTDLFVTIGLNLRLMIALALLAPFATVVCICGIVFWRRSSDPMALLFTLTLLLLYTFSSRTLLTYVDQPVLRHATSVAFAAAMVSLVLVLSLFPDGRWTPPWSRWLPIGALALFVAIPEAGRLLTGLLEGDIGITGAVQTVAIGWCVLLLVGLSAQFHRYRRVSGVIERQQTKWVVFPLGVLLAMFALIVVLPALLPGLPPRLIGVLLLMTIPFGIVLPIAVANAVLRYRLYEIDRAVSRTVSYALLTVALTAVYAGGVVGLGAVAQALTGAGGGELVVAASTLAVAALFQPLRRRIQALVDRRFNRARYDAHLTVEAFAQGLRDEVDLATLVGDLRGTAASVLEPRRVSVWLPSDGTASRGDPA